LYEYNFWYNHSVLVAIRYAGQEFPSRPAYRTATNTKWLYQKLYSYNCLPEDEAHNCSKHIQDSNKHIREEIVCQVGYLSKVHYEFCRLLYSYFNCVSRKLPKFMEIKHISLMSINRITGQRN